MPKYNLLIQIVGSLEIISKEVSYDAEYQLNVDVANIGIKGLLHKIGEATIYYPPHRIFKIDIEEIKS